MQRLAERLGFTNMSLYRYVPGKEQLTALMFDTAVGAPSKPATPVRESAEPWRESRTDTESPLRVTNAVDALDLPKPIRVGKEFRWDIDALETSLANLDDQLQEHDDETG
ncbi:hypothetical protein GCM10011610_56400 [Nocardia rhizosphaerihabitans]|uniref:TetR family transcriptional regulator n=1 Tax=Nocardia rhizosphaerihabitans TaxID=1691570 RepID=A0ABQ2KVC2_9NOCA|nr:hypothetical protein GCM10011610_56400 [Nocardia rhizosphaerihabitans]